MDDTVRSFLLGTLLPTVLTPLLIGLAVGLGSSRWRRAIFVYALVALLLYLFAAVIFYIVDVTMFAERLSATDTSATSPVMSLLPYAVPAVYCSSVLGTVGAFLALVLARRARRWGWFTILLSAMLISAIAVLFALSAISLTLFIKDDKQAIELFSSSFYTVIVDILVILTMIAQLAFALFGPRESRSAAGIASASDVTLP